ncbi:uncharacterized protein LODBEIA_P44180 [Lodderomyces beijingensis]|uniref:Uncharacterized protein n=1 Tax=Lodderomyces beijingensis TaxID=1775926 RepID=A0ABP0ZPX5_9ASCO
MSTVTITGRSKCAQPPFAEDQLLAIIEDKKEIDPTELVAVIGQALDRSSSKHKFIVHFTNFYIGQQDLDLKIDTDFAAFWDSAKDGCVTVQIKKESLKSSSSPGVSKGSAGAEKDTKLESGESQMQAAEEVNGEDKETAPSATAAEEEVGGASAQVTAAGGDQIESHQENVIGKEGPAGVQIPPNASVSALLITVYWISL